MSEPIPERADIRQLRIQAKELLRSLQSGETLADGKRLAAPKLADAQLLIARKYGFDSWPKLVDQVETPVLIEKFKKAVEAGDSDTLESLLKAKPALRKRIDEPIFSFDAPAVVWASSRPFAQKILPILVRYGADPNARSKWWAGGFSALDNAKGQTADVLLSLGAKLDVWSAAGQGRIDVLRDLLDRDPGSVNAPGGDGERPLHFASTPEIAELLIERGADVEQRDLDHEGTPIQYQIKNTEIVRVLLRHGATPDIFTAVALDDADLARKILKEDPSATEAKVGTAPFATKESDGGHIYLYRIGPKKMPHQLAADRGSRAVLEVLMQHASPARRLVVAAWLEDVRAVDEIVRSHPNVGSEMGEEVRSLTVAAEAGKTETVRLLLKAGVDPMTPGFDPGSSMHSACWFGYVEIVKLLLGHVPLEEKAPSHGGTPLSSAAHGANWCRNDAGDYVAVVETLLQAGADPNAPANNRGITMLAQAGAREDVKEVLRKYGAK